MNLSTDTGTTARPSRLGPAPGSEQIGQTGIFRGALVTASGIAGIVLLCKVVGFGEKIVVAHYLGTTRDADCYYVALSFVWTAVFITAGVLQPGVLPVYVAVSKPGSEDLRNQFAAAVAIALTLLLAALCVVVFLWPRACIRLIAPGLPDDANLQAAGLLCLLVPGLGVLTFTTLTRTILNSNQQFCWAALGELVFRATFFGGLALGLAGSGMGVTGAAFAMGALAGLATHVAAIVWRRGWPVALPGREVLPILRQTAMLAAPLLVGTALSQVSQVADSVLASLLEEGRICSLMYARKLVDAIVLLGPVALATVLFSRFAALAAEGGPGALRLHVLQAIRGIVLISGPIAVLVVVLRHMIVRTLFEHGQFDSVSTSLTSSALACYGLGIVAFSLDAALVSTFFALRDTRTPILIGIITTATDLVLAWVLMQGLGHAGIALSAALTKTAKVVWLIVMLDRRLDLQIRPGLLPVLGLAAPALGAMAIALYAGQHLWHLCALPANTVSDGLSLVALSTSGLAAFVWCGCWSGVAECKAVHRWLMHIPYRVRT